LNFLYYLANKIQVKIYYFNLVKKYLDKNKGNKLNPNTPPFIKKLVRSKNRFSSRENGSDFYFFFAKEEKKDILISVYMLKIKICR